MNNPTNGDGRLHHGVYLYWIPLGAGGTGFVRFNGRVYERLMAARERRSRLDLYHTALTVHVPGGDYVVETMWPSPPGDPAQRGVTMQAPVFAKPLGRSRIFRYEVRRWRDGRIPDADHAVGGPQAVAHGLGPAERLLDLAASVPPLIWGRDEQGVGDMWNSNSVVAWLLTQLELDMTAIRPPGIGRAPGWDAGVAIANAR